MNLRRLKALLMKERLQIVRDPSSILIAVILPLILLFLMGYAVSLDAKRIPLAIVAPSQNEASHTLISSFMGSSFFEITIGENKPGFLQQLEEGKLSAVLMLDEHFGKNGNYSLQLLTDGTEPNTAGLVQKYMIGVIQLWGKSIGLGVEKSIHIESRYWFNPPLDSRYFLLPGSIAVIMTLIGTLLTALVIAREWERGTMEALMTTPASMIEIIIGKLIPYFILGMGSMMLCFVAAYFWYEIPFIGSFGLLLLLSALYLFPALSIGLLISTVAKNQFVAAQASIIAGFLPAFLLSGFLFEIHNMPQWLQILTHVVPARYFVESLQTLFLAGDIYEIILMDIVGIVIIGLFFFGLVMKKTKRGLDQ